MLAGKTRHLPRSAEVLIDSIAVKDTLVTVYNFTVEKFHNYYVGNVGSLVHNNDCDDLLTRIDKLKLVELKKKIDKLGGDKDKFLKDFNDITDATLHMFGKDVELVDAWRALKGSPHRTDMQYLDFFSYIKVRSALRWIKNKKPSLLTSKRYSKLTIGETVALNFYTTEPGYQINFFLRNKKVRKSGKGGNKMTNKQFRIYRDFLDQACRKLPQYRGRKTLLRIEGKTQAQINQLKVGMELEYPNYISTAKNTNSVYIDGLKRFGKDPHFLQNVVIRVNNNDPIDIIDLEPFSQLSDEVEALIFRGKKMKITKIAYRQFPLPTKKRLAGAPFSPQDFLVDWITNNKKTVDGKMVNPNAISEDDYFNKNYTQAQLDRAKKILTIFVDIMD